jgi:hypothetical protein
MSHRWDDGRVRELARELPTVSPPSDAKLRLMVRVRALPPPQRRGRQVAVWAAVSGMAAAAAVALLVLATDRGHGQPGALEGDSWGVVVQGETVPRERLQDSGGRVERLWLRDGTIRLDIPPLELGRRVVVRTDEVELESLGGLFWVEARGGVLTRLEVLTGQVVERRGDEARVVRAGDTWRAPAATEVLRGEGGVVEGAGTEPAMCGATTDSPGSSADLSAQGSRLEAAWSMQVEASRVEASRVDGVATRTDVATSARAGTGRRPQAPSVVAVRAPDERPERGRARAPTALSDAAAWPTDTSSGAASGVDSSSTAARVVAAGAARAPLVPPPLVPPPLVPSSPRADPLARQDALSSADSGASVLARESRFVDGWYAYRRGSFEAAAAAFEDVVTYGGTDALAAEASYLRTRALLRCGSPGRAEVELRRYQARWPGAAHFHELCLELGLHLRPSLARPWLELAAQSADAGRREAARRALAELGR